MRELSWIYLYGVGGLIYALGSIVCIRAGVLDLKERGERDIFVAATGCLVIFALAHGLFQFVLPFVE
ncbi:MAG: hypothetical protein AAGC55_21110 [Myxococcota bacterium]